MTKSEKRHFKLFCSINAIDGPKDYLRLFDVIDAQESYDEDLIQEKFRHEPYFKQLKSVKHYLYKQVIRSLKNINDDGSYNIKMQNYFTEIDILFQRGLFESCTSIINKAKTCALKNEGFLDVIKLNGWESKIVIRTHNLRALELNKKLWVEEENEMLQKHMELFGLKEYTFAVQELLLRKGGAVNQDEVRIIEKTLSNPKLSEEKTSFMAEVVRLAIASNCYMMLDKRKEMWSIIKKIVALFDLHPERVEDNYNLYFEHLRTLIILSLELKEMAEAELTIQKMKTAFATCSTFLNLQTKTNYWWTQAFFLMSKGEFNETLISIAELDKLNDTSKKKLDILSILHIEELKFCIYFSIGDYKSAQHHLRIIMDAGKDVNVRLDMQTSARLAYLILQYEQKEYRHLEYTWRSTYRYLLKKENLQKAEAIFFQFLKRAFLVKSEKEILVLLAEFKEQIRPFNHELRLYIPLIEWIDSKIENKNLEEIVRRNYLQDFANAAEV